MWPHPVHPPFMELTACSSISGLYVYLLWVFLLSWPDQCLYLVTITFQLLAFHLGKEIPHHGTCTICIIQAYRFGRCRKSHLRQWFQELLHAISRFRVLWSNEPSTIIQGSCNIVLLKSLSSPFFIQKLSLSQGLSLQTHFSLAVRLCLFQPEISFSHLFLKYTLSLFFRPVENGLGWYTIASK